jgi:hypothetical protein
LVFRAAEEEPDCHSRRSKVIEKPILFRSERSIRIARLPIYSCSSYDESRH